MTITQPFLWINRFDTMSDEYKFIAVDEHAV